MCVSSGFTQVPLCSVYGRYGHGYAHGDGYKKDFASQFTVLWRKWEIADSNPRPSDESICRPVALKRLLSSESGNTACVFVIIVLKYTDGSSSAYTAIPCCRAFRKLSVIGICELYPLCSCWLLFVSCCFCCLSALSASIIPLVPSSLVDLSAGFVRRTLPRAICRPSDPFVVVVLRESSRWPSFICKILPACDVRVDAEVGSERLLKCVLKQGFCNFARGSLCCRCSARWDFRGLFEVCLSFGVANASACFTTTDRSGNGVSSTHTCTGGGEHTSTLTHLGDGRSRRGGIPFFGRRLASYGARTATQKRVF